MNDGERRGVMRPLYGILFTSCRKKMVLQRRKSDSGVSPFSFNLSLFYFLHLFATKIMQKISPHELARSVSLPSMLTRRNNEHKEESCICAVCWFTSRPPSNGATCGFG